MSDLASGTHLTGLNKDQFEAASHFEGPLLVLAGAGSGKTRVLTARVCNLIQEFGIPPGNILTVTFTNKAAKEMQKRLQELMGPSANLVTIATFHSFCSYFCTCTDKIFLTTTD